MDLYLEEKVALVTGAGRGIGNAVCRSLAKEGAMIIAVSRTLSDLEQLSHAIPKLTYFALDLAKIEEVNYLISELEVKQIVPDIIVHNVGGNLGITDPLCSLEEWQSVMRINLEIPIQLNRVFIPKMQQKQWGRICHISSISALENQGPPSYCAAKAALIAYTRSVGRFYSKDNVVLTSVLPGAIFTKGGYWDTASRKRPEHVEKYLKERMAIQRFGRTEEISELVTFFCSEHASFCIGSSILADGGQGRVFFDESTN